MNDHEARIVELETRLAFQDHAVAELNEAVVEQAKAMTELARKLGDALEDLRKLRTMLFADPTDEPAPPHY
jgi:SlyX protein